MRWDCLDLERRSKRANLDKLERSSPSQRLREKIPHFFREKIGSLSVGDLLDLQIAQERYEAEVERVATTKVAFRLSPQLRQEILHPYLKTIIDKEPLRTFTNRRARSARLLYPYC